MECMWATQGQTELKPPHTTVCLRHATARADSRLCAKLLGAEPARDDPMGGLACPVAPWPEPQHPHGSHRVAVCCGWGWLVAWGRSSDAEAKQTSCGIDWTMMGPRPAPGKPPTHLHAQAGMRRTGLGSSARSSCCRKEQMTRHRHRIHHSTLLQRSIELQGILSCPSSVVAARDGLGEAMAEVDCNGFAASGRGGAHSIGAVPHTWLMCDPVV